MSDYLILSDLVDRLRQLDHAYYNLNQPLVPDEEYDALCRDYQAATGQYWFALGTIKPDLQPVKHARPMLSLAKAYTLMDVVRLLPRSATYVLTPKVDGIALELRYEAGKLVQAVTRGDGETGEDVTHSLYQAWATLPVGESLLRLKDPLTLRVRGECYTRHDDFELMNAARARESKDPFKNWRNCVGGLLRSSEPSDAKRYLRFVAYDADDHGFESDSYRDLLFFLNTIGFPAVRCVVMDNVTLGNQTWEQLEALEAALADGFACDGLVKRVESLALAKQLGYGSSVVNYALACKFQGEQAVSTVVDVEWAATRTGRVVPTFVFEPVELMGTTVSRATGHNKAQFEQLNAGIGARIQIEKAGDIIPYVKGRVEPGQSIYTPEHCPACKSPLAVDEVDLLCANAGCQPKLSGLLSHMAARDRLDIEGLGESLAEALVQWGHIGTPDHLFELTEAALANLLIDGRRFGESRATKLVAELTKARQKPWLNVLYAMGCPRLGHPETTAITSMYRLEDLFSIADKHDTDMLTCISGIGPVKAKLIIRWLSTNQGWLSRLPDLGFNTTPSAPAAKVEGALSGKVVVLTGKFSVPKHVLEARLREAGAEIGSSVTKETSFLLAADGETGSSKYQKAMKLGLPIYGEGDVDRLV